MKRVESEAGRECEEKEIGDSYCTDGPTGPEGGEVSSEETNEEGGEGEGDRGLVDGGREVESERSDSTNQCFSSLSSLCGWYGDSHTWDCSISAVVLITCDCSISAVVLITWDCSILAVVLITWDYSISAVVLITCDCSISAVVLISCDCSISAVVLITCDCSISAVLLPIEPSLCWQSPVNF
ncbi:hypothetical protein ACOMHN_023907 [Nucella lapillus]